MKAATYSKTGTKATEVTLDSKVFGLTPNTELIQQAYQGYLANQRQNNAKVLTRAEVSGGGRKPWRQKGTGRARFGSSRVPIWRSGGIAHGPTGLENYKKAMPTKMAHAALRSALSAQAKQISVIESIALADGKTSSADALINKLQAEGNVLMVFAASNPTATRALRNLAGVSYTTAAQLSVFDCMNADVIVMEKAALELVTSEREPDMEAMIVKPIISEKSMRLASTGVYMFEVPVSANKVTISSAIGSQFKVEPTKVRVANLPGKTKRFGGRIGKRSDTKRAFVTLKTGQKIGAFEEEAK